MDTEITILTATLNADKHLGALIQSLRQQTDKKFRWVVADGCSTDQTESLVRGATDLDTLFASQKDCGIYDALNRGLQHIKSGYYLVVGADDVLDCRAVENFRSALKSGAQPPDFVAAGIMQDGHLIPPRENLGWLYGMQGIASSHAVGLLIRRQLHERFGFYSNKFPIAADQLFVKNAIRQGAKVVRHNFVAGTFGTQGTSGMDALGVLTEIFRVQVRTESSAALQYLIFGLRLGKYFIRSLLSGRGGR